MSTFGQRLKDERKRLGLTQPEFAAVGGVEKGAQINYEQDKRFPGADYLIAVAALGVDTQYVLLGVPSPNGLTEDESELLVGYRKLDLRAKARVLGVVEGASDTDTPPSAPKGRANITIHGGVGQQIHGETFKKVVGPRMVKVPPKKKS